MRKTVLFLSLVLAGCSPSKKEDAPAKPVAPAPAGKEEAKALLDPELGKHHRDVGAKNETAARLFDQGLTLAFAFNHDLAVSNFEAAAAQDPECAMAWWGAAYAHGPHYNNPVMSSEASKAAWSALEKARGLMAKAKPADRELIDALAKRYAEKPPADRSALDKAYADAMVALARKHEGDADVRALAAEALMNLHPWDLWEVDGKPKPHTPEILALLESILAKAPEHPLALHLYIHAVEGSAEPKKGLVAADTLGTLVPAAGHLVHMPAHIYIRTGAFAKASDANRRAIEADKRREAKTPRVGFYRIYMAHNAHFLAFSSALEGRQKESLAAARAMVSDMPLEFREALAELADGFLPVVLHMQVRFGLWEDVLKEPSFPEKFIAANAIRAWARGTAFGALGKLDEAEKELGHLRVAVEKMDARPIANNPAKDVLAIPLATLEGELAFRRGKTDEAIAKLREAAKREDALKYDEPPDWLQPVRHSLAAVLLAAEKFEDAEKVIEEDLARFPENGWSLAGLVRAKKGRGDVAGAKDAQARFEKAWANADVKIDSPCLCLPAK